MNHLYEQFASNISRTRINGSFRVLCKPRLIFSRVNGPNVLFHATASPRVELPASEVVALPGYRLWCKATGTPPIHTSLMWGSQVLDNSTGVPRAALNMEGKYTCKATSQAGTDSKDVLVSFTSKYWIDYNMMNTVR